ncbi:MAG: hypothetical protein JJ864_00355 [Rhizobiaceae bacterium]|nr:hypothetical protein [Rhizobiaceae bacterium]
MNSTNFAPVNSIVFISDNLTSKPPEHIDGSLVSFNKFCVSVGTYPEVDGETKFSLGRADEVEDALQLVFDGMIETPGRKLIISTVWDEVLLKTGVEDTETRTRVWVDHPRWPKNLVVGWG